MAKAPVLTNRKPADELAWLREQIRDLKGREDYIRRMILEGKMDPVGDVYRVDITDQRRKRFNRKEAEEELGDLSRFDEEATSQIVKVKELLDEEKFEAPYA